MDLQDFLNYGIAGLMLLWFMFRLERALAKLSKAVTLMATALLRFLQVYAPDAATELSKELHRLNGDG